MILAMICFLIGAMLGLRFKVLVLLPAIVVLLVATISVGIARSDSGWAILLATALGMVSLQLGYLAGTCTRFIPGHGRACKMRKTSLPAPSGVRQPVRQPASIQ
jgi:hypothetical protein